MPIGSDIFNSKGDIFSKLESLLLVLDIHAGRKKRSNFRKWKALFAEIGDNPISFILALIQLIKGKGTEGHRKDESQEKSSMRKPEVKQKLSEKQKERADKRAARKQNRRELLKYMNDSMDTEFGRTLQMIIKQAIANVFPKIPEILVDEIIRTFNCDSSMLVPVVGDGIDSEIIIRADWFDLFATLNTAPDDGVGKFYYEAASFDLGLYPPGKSPFSLNRFLYHVKQNPATRFPVYGASGKILFTIQFDDIDSFIINPHYKGPNALGTGDNITVYDTGTPNLSTPGGGEKFTIAEFLKDYFGNIKVIELQGFLGAFLELEAGLCFSIKNDGDTNYADVLGINKCIAIINKMIVACDGLDLGKISTDSVSHLAELTDDDSYFSFTTEEEKNLYLEAERKSKGVIKFEGCDDIEIPLDPIIFQNAADDIIAALNSGGDPYKAFSLCLQTGVEGSIAKHTGDTFKDLNWNWKLHFMKKLIVNFPLIAILAIMSPKIILIIVLIAVMVNNTTLIGAGPVEFIKIFKRVFFRIVRAVLAEVMKIVFEMLKQYLIKLLIIYVKMLLATQKGKRIKMILSLIASLLPFISQLQNAQNCKEILMIILKMIDATGIDVPWQPPAKFLQFANFARPGRNSLRTFQGLIAKLEDLGIHTGDMPDGSANEFVLSFGAYGQADEDDQAKYGRVDATTVPAIASGPPGAALVNSLTVIGNQS
jgi:hypothetical protein|tara:strand:- start:4821 stop:6947 length:2127 start_codon:yes stop_codon:yes gene_type:complete